MFRKIRFTHIFATIVVIIFTATGCSIKTKNHTANEFPWDYRDKKPSLYGARTEQQVSETSTDFRHKFLLEINPETQSVIEPYVFVNNNKHSMTGCCGNKKEGLFVYQPDVPDCATSSYEYYFLVDHKGNFGWKSTALHDVNGAPFKAKTIGLGRYLWWSSHSYPIDGDGTILLTASPEGKGKIARFYIQGLHRNKIRVPVIGLATGGDQNKFRIFNFPSSRELNCQAFLTFDVEWLPEPPDFDDSSTLVLRVEFLTDDGRWVEDTGSPTIQIRTRPYTPPG